MFGRPRFAGAILQGVGDIKGKKYSFLSASNAHVRLTANLHLGPVCLDVAQCMHPVPHVLRGLSEEIDG